MFTLIVVVFILGYAAIALEHPLRMNKAAPADVRTSASHFEGKKMKKRSDESTCFLETLEALGRAVEREDGWVRSG